MTLKLNAKVLLSGLMLAIFASMAGTALSYPAKAALVPLVIGLPGTVLCLIQLATELHRARAETAPREPHDVRREWVMYGWLIGFVVTVTLLGFMLAAPIVLYAYLRFDAKEPRWLSALIALGGLALIYGVFEYTLQVDLFDGLLTPIVTDWLGIS
jgi:hypothetical protein